MNKLKNWIVRDGIRDIFLILYFASQTIIFTYSYLTLLGDKSYSNIFNSIGHGLLLAKSSAGVINFNFMLLFVLINKGLIYKILGSFSDYIPLNEYINIHIYITNSIGMFSTIHVVAHIYNFIKLGDPSTLFFTTPAGITGIILVVFFIIMYVCAYLRKLINYNFFYYTHLLYLLIVTSMVFHGSFCFIKTNNGTCTAANFYKWVVGPFTLLFLEKVVLYFYSSKHTSFISIKKNSNDINEIELYKDDFQFKEGEWVLVNCPFISKWEWHPFTLTSNPVETGSISFHVKEKGDWTRKLVAYLLKDQDHQMYHIHMVQDKITYRSIKIQF
jgi:NADPH oxidase